MPSASHETDTPHRHRKSPPSRHSPLATHSLGTGVLRVASPSLLPGLDPALIRETRKEPEPHVFQDEDNCTSLQ
jgi:hypothetical protein